MISASKKIISREVKKLEMWTLRLICSCIERLGVSLGGKMPRKPYMTKSWQTTMMAMRETRANLATG